jgi:hypothetical protein
MSKVTEASQRHEQISRIITDRDRWHETAKNRAALLVRVCAAAGVSTDADEEDLLASFAALKTRVSELEREREGFLSREGRMDESWTRKSREEILRALEFQGATTRLSLENEKNLRSRVSELEAGVRAEVAAIPGAVVVREGGADEDVLKSLAVSVGRLKQQAAKLDIVVREIQGEPDDSIAADHAGPSRLDMSDEVNLIRKVKSERDACDGQLAAMREALLFRFPWWGPDEGSYVICPECSVRKGEKHDSYCLIRFLEDSSEEEIIKAIERIREGR